MRLLFLLVAVLPLAASSPRAVWIDTPSLTDDALALRAAINSPELVIRGITAPPDPAAAIPSSVPVSPDPAALANALRQERLVILAFGPATNIATLVREHPDLTRHIEEAILVAGRRPGEHLVPVPDSTRRLADTGFEKDSAAFRTLLESRVPLVLISWQAATEALITESDLGAIPISGLQEQLSLWRSQYHAPGIPAPGALAVAYLVNRRDLSCSLLTASIETAADDASTDFPVPQKSYLVVRRHSGGKTVTYCDHTLPRFKEDLLRRLTLPPRSSQY